MKYKIGRVVLKTGVEWVITENHDFLPACRDTVYREGPWITAYVEPENSPEDVGVSEHHRDSLVHAFKKGEYLISKFMQNQKKKSENFWRDELGRVEY